MEIPFRAWSVIVGSIPGPGMSLVCCEKCGTVYVMAVVFHAACCNNCGWSGETKV